MANREIGEVEIEIGDVTYLLRPTFLCLSEIEDKCNQGVFRLAEKLAKQEIRTKEIIAILWGGIYASRDGEKMPFTFEQFCDIVVEEGFMKLSAPAINFLRRALSGRPEEKKIPLEETAPVNQP